MLLTQSFVYIPTEFFCPIPFTKPLSVAYIAVSVYGIFLAIFASIYLWIYVYANRTTTSITVRRRRTINRQVIMLKRIILPTFSLMFLGIVYLSLFFQAIANQYQTHFLTYRLSYLFIAIGMSFIHVITILQTPTIKIAAVKLFDCLIWRSEENRNTTNQQQQAREEQMAIPGLPRRIAESVREGDNFKLAKISPTEEKEFLAQIVTGINSVK